MSTAPPVAAVGGPVRARQARATLGGRRAEITSQACRVRAVGRRCGWVGGLLLLCSGGVWADGITWAPPPPPVSSRPGFCLRCGDPNCAGCGNVALPLPAERTALVDSIWVRAEYLAWWTKGLDTPPLVTTAPRGNPGFLGQPGTELLIGGSTSLGNARNGGRLRVGTWLDAAHGQGFEAEYLALEDATFSACVHSGGIPTLARPFVDAVTNQPAVELIGYLPPVGSVLPGSGALCGAADVNLQSSFQAAGAHFQRTLFGGNDPCQGWGVGECALGYRYLQLREGLSVREDLTSLDPRVPNTAFQLEDSFGTRNEFHGVDVGLTWRRGAERWTLEVLTRLALGVAEQDVRIAGGTQVINTSTGQLRRTLIGGLLTQETNIGTYVRDQFAVVPEFEANLGYQVNAHVQVTFGYNFLYWSHVVRAGDQVDFTVNPTLLDDSLVGPARPRFVFQESGFWAQGLHFGAQVMW